ncbi:MAG TPA: TonB-dependent receptor [Ignavibacteria bacterium]|nr:TonB-dependent receptor [Ignavibacteria bacterium]
MTIKFNIKYTVILSFLFLMIFVSGSFSQSTGVVSGKVIDITNQQPVSDVSVSVLKDKQVIGGSVTDDKGFFVITEIPVGEYSLRFSLTGYFTYFIDNIVVNSGAPADVLAEIETVTTEEIEVTEERFRNPSDISNSFKNLTYEEIRRAPGGFEDIGRVVQTLPGVAFVNDGRNDLIVRGGSPSENLFLVDNAVIQNINHFGSQGATGGPVSIINLELVRDVSFVTGGFPAKFGDKLSSVLELKLREGNRDRFLSNINLSATGFGAVFEGPLGNDKQGSWIFSARRSYLDFIFNASGFGFVPAYSSLQLKGVYDFNNKNSLTVNVFGNLDNVTFNNDTEENIQDNETILDNDQKGYVNTYEFKTLLSKKSFALFNLGRTFNNFSYEGRDSSFNQVFTNNSKEGETTLKAEYFLTPEAETQLEFGAAWRFVDFENQIFQDVDTTYYISETTNERYVLPALDINDDNKTNKAYAFAQVTQTLFGKVKLNAGLRYDYFGFINSKNYISPRASVIYPFSEKLNMSFAYGTYYQSPSYVWLIANPANRNLDDIRADHYIAGLEYLFDADFRVTVEAYYKNYSDYPVSTLRPYIILANTGGDFEQTDDFGLEPLVSAGTGYSKGIELFIQKALTNDFYGTLNLSLFEAKYTALDGIERTSDFDNRYIFTLTGGYKFAESWEAGAKLRLAGGRPYTPINPNDGTRLVSEYNTARLPDYSRLDVRVDKNWNFKKWTLVTYIDIQNILNKKNITAIDWNQYTNLIEENESIGILPSIGINVMF